MPGVFISAFTRRVGFSPPPRAVLLVPRTPLHIAPVSYTHLDVYKRQELDSSIAIRSLLVKDGQVSCWGGGGIVADSSWQAEYQESITKVKVLLDTLERLGR